MAQILVRNLDPKLVEGLKRQAKENGRSLQAEAKTILERSAGRMSPEEFRRWAQEFRKRFGGRKLPDSTEMIREDRDNR